MAGCFCKASSAALTTVFLFGTVINSRVLWPQIGQPQIHHAVAIISADFYTSSQTACITVSAGSWEAAPDQLQWFSCRFSDPDHNTAIKTEAWSSTGETKSFPRLFHYWTGRNGLHALTCNTWWDERREEQVRHLESCNGATNEYHLMFFDIRKIRSKKTYRAEREQWAEEWVYSSSWWRCDFWSSMQYKRPAQDEDLHHDIKKGRGSKR